jgi:hypothetical protein
MVRKEDCMEGQVRRHGAQVARHGGQGRCVMRNAWRGRLRGMERRWLGIGGKEGA